jgi:predicted aspartyl protease
MLTFHKITAIVLTAWLLLGCNIDRLGDPSPQDTLIEKALNQGTIKKTSKATVPLRFSIDTTLVKVRLNGSKKTYTFMLDTGAYCAVTSRVARALNLPKISSIPMVDTTGKKHTTQLVHVKSISVGKTRVDDLSAFVISSSNPMLQFFTPGSFDGILGSNFLKHFRVTLNYPRKTMSLEKSHAFQAGATPIAFSTPSHLGAAPTFDCSIEGIKLIGMIDTGAHGITMPSSIMSRLKHDKKHHYNVTKGSSSGGMYGISEQDYIVRLARFEIGSIVLKNVTASTSNSPAVLLGKRFLSNHLTIIDYPRKQLLLRPFGDHYRDDDTSSYGIALHKQNGIVRVIGIWQHSQAGQSPLRVGDEIVRIDGRLATQYSMYTMRKLFRGRTSPLKLEYKDQQGTLHQITLRKAPLI